jgi:dihydrofolate synthase/folylpolyglutamate synthase
LQRQRYNRLHIVFGMMNDKKIDHVLALMPKTATYYFTNAEIPRALDAKTLQNKALMYGLKGNAYASVHEALNAAKAAATPDDFIFIGGSNYIIGEIL